MQVTDEMSDTRHMTDKVHTWTRDIVVNSEMIISKVTDNGSVDNNNRNNNNNDPLRVCIIGAGAAGLVSARHMINDDTFDVTIYEQTHEIGGTWCYTDEVGFNSKTGQRIHGSMYSNLRTNLPLNIMEFPDFPVKGTNCNFQSHRDVLQYLQAYVEHFHLAKVIKFNHKILHVARMKGKWLVTVQEMISNTVTTEVFDCVVVASGRYSVPKTPKIDGMNRWRGTCIHTHDYRRCDDYAGQTVLVLGAGPSGVDISMEVSTVAKKVYLCHNLPSSFSDLDDIMVQVKGTIVRVDETSVHLSDGRILSDVDSIIFATGYKFDLKFLDLKACDIVVDDHQSHVTGLYQHFICIAQPSLCIFAVPFQLLPFPLYHQQAAFYVAVQKGRYTLPTAQEMKRQEHDDLMYRKNVLGFPTKYAHKMTGDLLWKHDDFLAAAASVKPVAQSKRQIFKLLRDYRQNHTKNYRQLKFIIHDDDHFETIDPAE